MSLCLLALLQFDFLEQHAEYAQLYLAVHAMLYDRIENPVMNAAGKASMDGSFDPATAGAELWKIAQQVAELVDLPLEEESTKQQYMEYAEPYFTKLCTDRVALNLETSYRHEVFLLLFCTSLPLPVLFSLSFIPHPFLICV